jgi:soluble lytic murein transglycosylase-like protein
MFTFTRALFDFAKRNLQKAEDNIEVGTTILRTMLDQHGEENAIAAYNGLLPEKQKYAQRVKAVITRAEFPTDGLKVSSDSNGGSNSYSDWIAALSALLRKQIAFGWEQILGRVPKPHSDSRTLFLDAS